MTKHLVSSIALAALGFAGTAIAAPPPVSGYVGIGIGSTWADFQADPYGEDSYTFVANGEARINAWMSSDQSIQLDVEGEVTPSIDQFHDYNPSYDNDGRMGALIGGHWSWRNPEALVGVFAAYAGQTNLDYDGNMNHIIVGAEAQYRMPTVTLYGQVGHAQLVSDSDEDEPQGFTFFRLVGRYFATTNDKVEAEIGYGESGVNNDPSDMSATTWGLSWQHRFDHSPYSATLGYAGFTNDNSDYDNWAHEHIVTVAVNFHFGDETLAETNANGATLDMPTFERAFAWSYWTAY